MAFTNQALKDEFELELFLLQDEAEEGLSLLLDTREKLEKAGTSLISARYDEND